LTPANIKDRHKYGSTISNHLTVEPFSQKKIGQDTNSPFGRLMLNLNTAMHSLFPEQLAVQD